MQAPLHHFLKPNRSGWPSKPADGGAVSQDRAPGLAPAVTGCKSPVHSLPRRAYQGRRVSLVPSPSVFYDALQGISVPASILQDVGVIIASLSVTSVLNVNVEREKHHQNPQLREHS